MSDEDLENEDEIEDDEELDEDGDLDIDDDEAMSQRRTGLVRPFSSGSGSSYGSSSRLPGSAPGSTSSNAPRTDPGASRYGSQSNLPGSPPSGGSTYGNRPSSPTSGGTTYGNRPSTPTSPTSGGATYGNRPSSPTSPTSGGSSTYGNRPSTPSSPTSGGSSTYGNRPGTPSSPSAPSSSGSSYGGNRPTSPSSPASGSSSGSSSSSPVKKDEPKSRNPLSGISNVTQGLGGLRDRLPGGGNKDNKPAAPKSSGGGSNPLSKGIGGLRDRLPGGNKDSKPAAPKTSSGGSNPLSKGISGLRDRLPGGNKSGPTASASSAAPSRPGMSSGASSAASPSRPSFGGGRSTTADKPATPKGDAKKGQSLAERLKASLPFGGNATKKTTMREKVERASKAPKVDEAGLTLDNKLDILGVGLLLGSLALFFSSMSSTQGQLTQPVLNALSELLGWGALAVPVTMFAIGIWLIIRHFGEDAPMIDPVRISGVVLVYTSLLITFQYIDSFQSLYTLSLLDDFLKLSINAGRGGGWVGAQLYKVLVLNITELGGMFSLAGLYIISLMLMLRISAAELAIFVISIGRSFAAAQSRRSQERAARARLAAATQAARAELEVSVSKPVTAELSDGKAAAALPMGETLPLPEPRPIPITKGGRTVTAFFGEDGELVPVENEMNQQAASMGKQPAAEARSSFASRLMNAVPLSLPGGSSKSDDKSATDKPAEEKSGGLLSGGLFSKITSIAGRDSGVEAEAEKSPAAASAPAAQAANGASAPATPTSNPAAPAATNLPPQTAPNGTSAPGMPRTASFNRPQAPQYAPPASRDTSERTPSVGDLARPQTPNGVSSPQRPAETTPPPYRRPEDAPASPYGRPADAAPPVSPSTQQPAAQMPQVAEPVVEKGDSEDLSTLPPAKPKGIDFAASRPTATSPFGSPTANRPPASTIPAALTDEDEDEDDGDDVQEEQLPASERNQRLDALRAGYFKGASANPPATSGDKVEAPTPPNVVRSPSRPLTPAAYPSDANTTRPAPRVAYSDDSSLRDKVDDTPDTRRPNAPAASVGANGNGASSSFRRPETPPISGAQAPHPAGKPRKVWKLPDFRTLLNPGSETDFDRETLLQRARVIEETLQSFGAPGRVVEVNTGPVITQFGVEPDYLTTRSGKKNRVKVGAIAQLDKDLQLALGAKSIRIEAPVPGKGYVGIEVPNEEASVVSLRDVMESDEFKKIKAKSPLAIALGQSVDGAPVAADLASMPHLLVAGTTGSGKSVLVNAIITSLILSNPPDRVKFIMVDPKRVELTGYNGIPHLIAPVVVDLERTVGVLKWVTREMDERYKQFSAAGARNIEDFNKHLNAEQEQMPYIVVIIDELADLMMLAPDETERVITRIAALARATGIHLVIATQRPSVDVVTGLIKANFPARIAFAVAGGVDSRVILDQPGAERLLGKGDMLYLSGNSPSAVRLQGVYVSDAEIPNITRYWKMAAGDDIQSKPLTVLNVNDGEQETSRRVDSNSASRLAQSNLWGGDDDDDEDDNGSSLSDNDQDELYDQAVEMVRRLNKASVSLLQRRLRIGYTRAARLIDMMEEEGIVGPAQEGSKPRDVLQM